MGLKKTFHRLQNKIFTHKKSLQSDPKKSPKPDMLTILMRAIALGKSGILRIMPEHIGLGVTANCNLRCIMCPGHDCSKGAIMTVSNVEDLISGMSCTENCFGTPQVFDVTSGEPTLDPYLAEIFELLRKRFPDARVQLTSNATLPVKKNISKAFELATNVAISIDGATAKTYERIRRGASFNKVIKNVEDIVALKKKVGNVQSIVVFYVAMDLNIHELPAMVELLHNLGISRLFVQECEDRGGPFNHENENISLTLSDSELQPILSITKKMADKHGIHLGLTSRFSQIVDGMSKKEDARLVSETPAKTIPCFQFNACLAPWTTAPIINLDHDLTYYPRAPCCHMPHMDLTPELMSRSDYRQGKTIADIFNSSTMWDVRLGLLDGSLASTACRDCQYSVFIQWTPERLNKLQAACEQAERNYLS